MAEILTISNTVPRKSLLFRSLREKGIEELQQTATEKWSDHNVHDPGITIAEALCYVITEISSQLNFSFEDLIATPQGIIDANINYPSAATNLPCKAVTFTDFRKVILDLPEIRNAFFEITNESKLPVYYTLPPTPLTYDAGPNSLPIRWGGLYSIQLEMEVDDLNENFVTRTIVVGALNIPVTFSFKYWDEVTEEWFKSITITGIALEDTIVQIDDPAHKDYYSEWTINFSDGSVIVDFPVWIKAEVSVDPLGPVFPNMLIALEAAIGSIAAGAPLLQYKTRLMAVQVVTNKVMTVFQQNRNLGEDISFFSAVRLQEIGMNATVEIRSTADPVENYAQIIFAVESFFLPRPLFQSLEELMAQKDFKIENIFLGPLLDSGFLSEENLNSLSAAKTAVYVSDLLHIILDLPEITTVSNFSLSTYFNNFQAIVDERNCIKIPSGYKPRLSIPVTSLTLTRNGIPVEVDQLQVDVRLAALRAAAAAGPGAGPKDLDIPFGTLPPQSKYRSVQYELPVIYGTGAAGISLTSTPERIAQLKQLQGYLFLFDQVLANTFSQLANVGDLFAVHQQQSRTYHQQFLYHLPGARDLIGYMAPPLSWQDFIAASSNTYTKLLDEAGEPGDTFFQRRNTMLDYLLSRTQENRQDYAAILSSVPGNSKQIILHDKEDFLEKYPVLSQARARAYNYKLLTAASTPDVWDSDNVGGYAKMVARKLGFISSKERTLYHPLSENFVFFNVIIPPVRRRYRMIDNGGNDLMVCRNHFPDDATATEAIKVFFQAGRYLENYEIFQLPGGNFSFTLVVPTVVDMIYNGVAVLATRQDAINKITDIIGIIGEKYLLEGMHVVEHILLRPRIRGLTPGDSDRLFATLTVEESKLPDPYSHVVTVVLPSAMEKDFSLLNSIAQPTVTGYRWRDAGYLQFAQQTILREAPSHLLVNIFSLDRDTDPGEALIEDRPSLQNFERKWKAWREATADPAATITVKRTAQQKLVTVLEKIYGA